MALFRFGEFEGFAGCLTAFVEFARSRLTGVPAFDLSRGGRTADKLRTSKLRFSLPRLHVTSNPIRKPFTNPETATRT